MLILQGSQSLRSRDSSDFKQSPHCRSTEKNLTRVTYDRLTLLAVHVLHPPCSCSVGQHIRLEEQNNKPSFQSQHYGRIRSRRIRYEGSSTKRFAPTTCGSRKKNTHCAHTRALLMLGRFALSRIQRGTGGSYHFPNDKYFKRCTETNQHANTSQSVRV